MPRCNRGLRVSLLTLVVSGPWTALLAAQPPSYSPGQVVEASTADSGAAKPTIVKMTLHAAAVPAPAMRYYLLPEVRDLKPGNAALLYQRAHSLDWWLQFLRAGEGDKIA